MQIYANKKTFSKEKKIARELAGGGEGVSNGEGLQCVVHSIDTVLSLAFK